MQGVLQLTGANRPRRAHCGGYRRSGDGEHPHDDRPGQRSADSPHRAAGHARNDRAGRLRCRRAHRARARRTAWRTSSSTSCSRAARSIRPTRDVNETAERIGGVLNAYTSHDLVAFHITVRAERALEAIDLLTDFVGRPRIDAEELDQRARRGDPGDPPRVRPAVDGRRVPDRQGGLRRPPARAHRARPRGAPAHASRARGSSPSASAAGPARAAARSSSATSTHLPDEEQLQELFARFPALASPGRLRADAGLRTADARRGARHQPVAPAHDLPPADRRLRRAPTRRAVDLLDLAGRLDGLAPVRRDPRATRPLLLGLRDRARLRRRADPAARLGP